MTAAMRILVVCLAAATLAGCGGGGPRVGPRVISPFGALTSADGKQRFYGPNIGIDLAAAVGTPVLAAADGLVWSIGDDGPCGTVIVLAHESFGTEGFLTLDNAYEYAADEMRLHVDGKHGQKTRTFRKRDQIAAEIEYFARCIRDDLEPEPSGWEGLADVRILQAIQASARFGRAVPIDPVARPRRPDLGQEIRIPAHGLPALVDVEQPTK